VNATGITFTLAKPENIKFMNRIKFFSKDGKYAVTRFGQFIILPVLVALIWVQAFMPSVQNNQFGEATKTKGIYHKA